MAVYYQDISANLSACEEMTAKHNCDMVLLESGGGGYGVDVKCNMTEKHGTYLCDTPSMDRQPGG